MTRNAIEYCGTRYGAAQGARSIALNGASPGGIAQTFATATAAEYVVHFFMTGDTPADSLLKHMRATAAGQSQDYEFDATHAWPWGMGWLEKTFTFTATSSSTTLEFYSLDAGDTGPVIDSVVVRGPAVDVSPGGRVGLALEIPYPNPTQEACWVTFAVPTETPLRLSVLDIQGREISLLAVGTYGPGRHTSRWSGEIMGGRARAGLYFIRLTSPGATLVRKAVFAP